MKKLTFEKMYTRDTSMLIQVPWTVAMKKLFEDISGDKLPYSPLIIHHLHKGAYEIWDCAEGMEWCKDILQAKISSDEEWFTLALKKYDLLLTQVKEYWSKGTLDSMSELKDFYDLIAKSIYYFVIWYYAASDERTPAHLREICLAMREVDVFFDTSDKFIRKTMLKHRADIAGLEAAVNPYNLLNIPTLDVLKELLESSILIGDESHELSSFDDFAKKHPEFHFLIEKPTTDDLLKGQVACKGKVRGKVRVLRKKAQVSELQEGEILVMAMTTPDFVPAMKKAAAFVTDEGGVTCHAAIIARELNKPCIISTKHATSIFKDGDMVEVDANTGVVRKV